MKFLDMLEPSLIGLRRAELCGSVMVMDRAVDIYETPSQKLILTDGKDSIKVTETELTWLLEWSKSFHWNLRTERMVWV